MKKILSLLLCSLSFYSGFSQDIPCTVKKSEVFKDEYKHSYIVSVDEDNEGGMVVVRSYQGGILHSGSAGYYFEHYDKDMKLVKEFEYPQEDRGGVLGITVKDGKVNIIDFMYDKDDKSYVCSANVANIVDFRFSTKELFRVQRDEIKRGIVFFGFGGYDNDSFATMLVNNDKTAFGISLDIDDKEERNEMHKIYVYDFNLNLKIEHTFKRQIKDRKFRYENIDISNDGSAVFLLGKAVTKDAKKKKDGGKYQYELTRITNTDSKTQAFDTKEHFAASLKTVAKKDRIACVGFYSDRNDSRFKGLCYFDMDPATLEIKTSKFNPFTEQFMVDKYGKDKDKELKNISFRDVFLTPNNDIVFNAEEYYVTTTQTMGPNGSMGTINYIYHYDDIVSAKMSDKGDLIWARNINKRQSTAGDNSYISYSSIVKGDNTFFFINTGDKVKKLKNERIQFNQKSPKRSNLNVIRIGQNGDFDYQELLDDEDNEVPFMVSQGAASKQGNAMYFIGRKGKKKQLLKISVE